MEKRMNQMQLMMVQRLIVPQEVEEQKHDV